MNVVFSQPMYLPWQGLFDQCRMADIFVHYDDAQYSKGGFLNRVQMKTPEGFHWLSVPVRHHLGDGMLVTAIDYTHGWQDKHISALAQTLTGLPHASILDEILPLLRTEYDSLAELNITLFEHLARRMGLSCRFVRSSTLGIASHASDKVRDVVKAVGGTTYITGHGARNYLDHTLPEASGIRTEYIDYHLPEYLQKFGAFNPYVTVLTLLAAVGYDAARAHLTSTTVYWKDYVERPQETA